MAMLGRYNVEAYHRVVGPVNLVNFKAEDKHSAIGVPNRMLDVNVTPLYVIVALIRGALRML